MARAVESLGELQEPASLTPLPPLGMPVPAETNSSFIQVTPVCCHLSCRLTRPFTERSSGRAGWDSPGWQNLLLLAEQLCFAVKAALTSRASPLLQSAHCCQERNQKSLETEDEVSHWKVLVLVSPPWRTLVRVLYLWKSQGGQQSPEPAMQVSVGA